MTMSTKFPNILVSVLFQALAAAHIEDGENKKECRHENKSNVPHQKPFLPNILPFLPKQAVSTSLEICKGFQLPTQESCFAAICLLTHTFIWL